MVSDRFSEYLAATIRNAISMFTSKHNSAYQNYLLEMLNEKNIPALLPSSHISKIYPEGHPNNVWWNHERENKWLPDGKTLFGFLLQNRSELGCNRDVGSLIDFRNRIMMPFIDRGLDVNQHIRDFYTWSPSSSSSYPNVLVELIRNGLSKGDT